MKNVFALVFFLLATQFVNAQYMYDGNGKRIGRVDGQYYYDGSGSRIGRVDGEYIYNSSGSRLGRVDGQYIYNSSGSRIGRIDGDYLYNGSGSRIGRVDGNYIYDGYGKRIGRADGLRRMQIILFFYFYMWNDKVIINTDKRASFLYTTSKYKQNCIIQNSLKNGGKPDIGNKILPLAIILI